MKIIVGLGNPGKQYEKTWHNLGFLTLDEFQKQNPDNFDNFKLNKKFKAEISIGKIDKEKIILAKPQTFMNLSGESIKLILKFYKIKPNDLWAIHDDIDLSLGKIKISQNSSAAGHKGVQNIIDNIKTKNFTRFRIGIKAEREYKIPTEEYVLQKFSKEEEKIINQSIEKTIQALNLAIEKDVKTAMNEFNKR